MSSRACVGIVGVLAACGFDSGDTTPPTIVAVAPIDGAAEVWLHDPITVTFSEPIDPVTVNATTVGLTGPDGGLLRSTATLGEGGAVMTVQVADDVAAISAVRMTLTGGIADLSGNPLAEASVGWTLPPWSRAEMSGAEPALAVGDGGQVVEAWSVGANGARRVVVSEWGASGWVAMGGELGARDAAMPSITLDAQDRPVVVWTESGGIGGVPAEIHGARWDGGAWLPLASPGEGSFAVAARPPDGDPVIAYTVPGALWGQTLVRVRLLVDDAWTPLATNQGFDVPVNGALSGLPQLAVPASAMPVVVFAETGTDTGTAGTAAPVVRILRWTGTWQEVAPVPLGLPPTGALNRVAVAVRGDTIDVAYDTHSGFSYGVHVVAVEGLTWTAVGGELDIDSPADAQAPALAIGADGAPIVAWRELVEGNWRGFLARWDGTAWRAVGGGAWNDDPTRAIVRPVMALSRGRAPIITWGEQSIASRSASAVRVARWNGPATPSPGLDARASIAGCAFDGTQLTLGSTGCFSIADGRATPHPGLVPYDLVSELWSDGALKRRWIALPDGQMLTASPTGAWTAPTGTMMIKEFALETTPGDPRTRRVMETRFLINVGTGGMASWQGYSFRWRSDGTDADLLPDAASTVDWSLDAGNVHTHGYPSRQQCARCHHASTGPLLGVRTGQLARRFDYDGVMADQLETLAHVGVIATQSNVPAFAAPHDASLSLEVRMRGYLAANCAHCHNPGGERPNRDFRWETPLAQTQLCGTDNEVVAGDPAASVIVQRMSTRVNGMPPLATLETDPLAIDVVSRWIAGESSCP